MTSVLLEQDGSKVFTASCDKTAKMWDLNSNQAMQIAQVRPQPSSFLTFKNRAVVKQTLPAEIIVPIKI
jgi:WD40 repeat protein